MKSLAVTAWLSAILFAAVLAVPVTTQATVTFKGLTVVCEGSYTGGRAIYKEKPNGEKECDFGDFISLLREVIKFMMFATVPLSTIAFIYIGFKLITSQGDPEGRKRAKQVARDVLMGFIFVMSAFLIVYTITSVLDDRFNQFISK